MILAALLATTGVLDVDRIQGPYFQIRDAVAAASSGDVIRVNSGVYMSFGIFGKDIVVAPRRPQDSVQIVGTVRVQNLSASQSVVLDGLDVQGMQWTGDAPLIVAGCAGSVRIQDSSFRGIDTVGGRIEDSDDVVLSDCTATSSFGATLSCTDSSVTFFGGEYRGWSFFSPGLPGLDAIACTRTNLLAHGALIQGGWGGEEDGGGLGCNIEPGPGGNAIAALDSTVRILGGSVSGGPAGFGFWCPAVPNGERVVLGGTSTLVDYAGDGIDLDVRHSLRNEGATVNVSATGAPGTPIVLAVGTAAGRVDLPAFTGDLYVGGNLATVRRIFAGVSPAQLQLTLPQLPPQEIAQVHFQAVELRPSELVFGESRVVTVLDSAW